MVLYSTNCLPLTFVVDRAILSRRMNVENSPDVIPDAAIYDLLYSQADGDIEKLLRFFLNFSRHQFIYNCRRLPFRSKF